MKQKHQCNRRVYSGARYEYTGHMCRQSGTVERDGKWYCKQHDPVAIEECNRAERAKWDIENKISHLEREIATTKERIVDRARKDPNGPRHPLIRALLTLEDELERMQTAYATHNNKR